MIIVDYADLLKPVTVRREKRNELESIYEELRGISTEFQCPVWTASQTNRSGLNAEVVTMEQISEAFNKCFVADLIFTLSRTADDKQNNTGKIFIAKNRNGPDGLVFDLQMDTSNVSIQIVNKPAAGSIQAQNQGKPPLDLAAQKKLLLSKYNKFKGKTK
tara:strand:- start:479 stop:958 length:480 start_codon:yes stop_codon:yes gene_type:complete